jgi:triosephosphate isomerase
MRTPFVVGNWKLHKTVAEALALVTELKNQLGAVRDVAFGVAPPYTALWPVARRLDGSNVVVAGQDCFYQDKGAWTGAVGPAQLLDVGCTWVIIGHS